MPIIKDYTISQNSSITDISISCQVPVCKYGDILIALIFSENPTVTWSSIGWNQYLLDNTDTSRISILYKIASDNEQDTIITFSEECITSACILALSDSTLTATDISESIGSRIVDGGYTHDDLLRLMASALLGKINGAGTGMETFRDICDTKDRIVATVDENGNRENIIFDISPCLSNPCSGYNINSGVDGGIFITDIIPTSTGNIGNKVFSNDGVVLESCVTDTNLVTVFIIAITGHTNYIPNCTVNGLPITLTQNPDRPIFNGSIQLDITGKNTIIALHEDGASDTASIIMDQKPVILSAVLSNIYPNSQTELKAGDLIDLLVTVNMPVVNVEIENYGACILKSYAVTGNTFTIKAEIADRGTILQNLAAQLKVQKSTGSWSDLYTTSNTVSVNNLYPSLAISSVTYPNFQGALKNSESAIIVNTASNYNHITYTSPTGELNIANSLLFESNKLVTRISGSYNLANQNILITATRTANGASKSISGLVRIVNIAPSITVSLPAARLRSGGNNGTVAQVHQITITSSQPLLLAPTMQAQAGTFGTTFSGSGTTWKNTLTVHDNDPKGIFNFTNLSASGLSGIETTTINTGLSYELGGFVFRVLTVPAYPVRSTSIGTSVTNTSKLRCTNLSKGASGSLNYTYQATQDEALNKYTILTNNTWYNCDGANATSNTTGTMQIELEEVV